MVAVRAAESLLYNSRMVSRAAARNTVPPMGSSADPADASDAAALSSMSFEQALDELDALVRQMESGELPLEASIAAYRRGAALARHCQGRLAAAEQEIVKLDGDALVPLDPSEMRGGA
jgi:exodeoxyribonuclease VII small subunit